MTRRTSATLSASTTLLDLARGLAAEPVIRPPGGLWGRRVAYSATHGRQWPLSLASRTTAGQNAHLDTVITYSTAHVRRPRSPAAGAPEVRASTGVPGHRTAQRSRHLRARLRRP